MGSCIQSFNWYLKQHKGHFCVISPKALFVKATRAISEAAEHLV